MGKVSTKICCFEKKSIFFRGGNALELNQFNKKLFVNSFAIIIMLFCFATVSSAAVSDVIIWDGVRTEAQMQDTLANGYSSSSGMRLWWDFSNVNNLGYDATGNGHTGIVKGVVSGLTMSDPFTVSRTVATGFNNDDCYIVGNPAFTSAKSDRTYEFWIRNPAKNGSVFFSITNGEAGGGSDDLKRMWVNADGSLTIADHGYYTGFQEETSSALTWTNNQWYQIIVVFDYTGGDRHTIKVYRGSRPSTFTKLLEYEGSSLGSQHWLAIGGHEEGYYTTGDGRVGKGGFLGCDGTGVSPVITPEAYGAVGNGVADDTDAWRKACAVISAYGQGTLRLTSGATYLVGRETTDAASDTPYYNAAGLGYIVGATGSITIDSSITGSSATVKLANGMHFGAFYPTTGAIYSVGTTTDPLYAACPGDLLKVEKCADVEIKDIKLDGNIANQVWGGRWTQDSGIQLPQNGINLKTNEDIYIHDVECNNNGLDGISVSNAADEESALKEVLIEDVKCKYNGRQGLSYNCGNHLEVYDSEFSHSARTKSNTPGCGVDVEPMGRYMAPGVIFDNCKFFDNKAYGLMLCGVTEAIIRDCLMWGTTNYGAMSYHASDTDNLFVGCTIYGGFYNRGQRTRLESCTLLTPATAYYSGDFPNASVANKIVIEQVDGSLIASGCTIQSLQTRYSTWINDAVLQNCTVTHGNYDTSGMNPVAVISGSYLLNTKFNETSDFASYPLVRSYINDFSGTSQIGKGVVIEGPTSGSQHYVDMSTWLYGPFDAETVPVDIPDGVLTPNAGTGETQINTGATYTAVPAFDNPADSTGNRLFDKDLPYDDWNTTCGINYCDQTVTIDLNSSYNIRSVQLRMTFTQKPKRVYVYVGDGTNWTQIGLIQPREGAVTAPWFDATVCNPVSGRYVKLDFENDGEWGWYIKEVKVYGYAD